jgi:glycosyltransferase involved in cell wall biosynthesis
MLVSILIPCRNAATTLRETLESALAQGGVETEIIVVDDGSSDGSLEIAKDYEVRGVRVIEGPRINASAARNRALQASSGDYIQYLDADDLLGANKISQQVEVLEKYPDCVATARWGRFTHTAEDAVFANDDQLRDWSPVDWLVFHCGQHQMMHPAAWLLPRTLAERAGLWDERLTLNDDGEYFARVVGVSRGLKCVVGATSYYRTVSAPSLSKSRSRKAFESFYCSLLGTINVMLGLESSGRTRASAADALQRFMYEVYPAVRRERFLAASRIKELGGSALRPDFGPQGELISRLLGWRAAILLTRLSRKKQLF